MRPAEPSSSAQGNGSAVRATMEDIARACGISKMSVSRVLSGHSRVSPNMRERVLAQAKLLNYELNSLARNLSTNTSGFIGIATPFEGLVGSNYFAQVIKGLAKTFRGNGFDFALFDTLSSSFDHGEKLARIYRQRRVDGILAVAPHADEEFLDTLSHLGIPLVVVGEKTDCPTVSSVSCDDALGIRHLCSHLFDLGHRRIAFVGGPGDLVSAERRKTAFLQFCKARKITVPDSFLQPGDYTMHAGRVAGLLLLAAPPRPTAIIAANDLMAYGVIESARELQIVVPDQVSVAGFDDLPAATESYPSLTTVHQPILEMSEKAGRILLHAIQTGTSPSEKVRMKVSLTIRQSTGPSR